MSSPMYLTMSPEELIFTFKQGSEESFKEAWSTIFDAYGRTEPKMTLSFFLSSFYFWLALCYRYALDAVVGGDFLQSDGDQAFNAIKKLVVSYGSTNKIDSTIASIHDKLKALELEFSYLKDGYNKIHEVYDYVPMNFEPSMWVPAVKVTICGEVFHAHCDIMSEFCLMPKSIYESLKLWGLSDCGERITLTDNTVIRPFCITILYHIMAFIGLTY